MTKNKTINIAGASQGVGKAIVAEFARRFEVVNISHDETKLKKVASHKM